MTSQRDIDNEKGASEAVRLVLRARILEQSEALTGGEKSVSTDDDRLCPAQVMAREML
jgi:hypothetical protein